GAPDAVVLSLGGTIVDTVSYEGDTVAPYTEGSGAGLVDDGVQASESISRCADGTDTDQNNVDFMLRASTPGTANDCPVPVELVVLNEIDYDQPSTDTAEFVELFNTGNSVVDLSQYSLQLVNGSGGGAALYQTINLPAVSLSAGDYFVVCGDAATVINCDLDVSPDSNLIQNGSPDAVALLHQGIQVDAVSYEGNTGASYTEGSGVGLEDPSSGSYQGISRFPNGIDTNQNNSDWSVRCITPGTANTSDDADCAMPTLPQLVINEIDYDQPSTDTAEFIEIKNAGLGPVDLTGYSLELVNGNGTSVYDTIALPAISLAAGDYFVVCANAITVANCDLDDGPDTNFIQNGSPDAVALTYAGLVIDTVSYEGDTGAPYTEGSGAGLEDSGDGSISRCADGVDTNQNNVDFALHASTPGLANDCPPPPPPAGFCGDPATPIFDIQGNGAGSPLNGTVGAVIEGVVVADFQNGDQLRGFFVQEEPAQTDADPSTSDGIFVFDNSFGVDVAVGDIVRVQGTVTEFFDLTELNNVSSIAVCGVGAAPAPAAITLPVTAPADLEAFEGMLVTFPQTLFVTGNFTQGRYGEVDLSVNGRLFNPTHVAAPGAAALAVQDLNNHSRIQLDDASTIENPLPLPPYLGVDNTLRSGDSTTNLTGVLGYSFNSYELHPTSPVSFTRANPRQPSPPAVGGNLRVASMNLLNYFTTLDNGSPICGPVGVQDCRGANTPAEFSRQRAKIISAIAGTNADIVGLMELENNPNTSIADLVNGLNTLLGPGVYDYVNTGTIGSDAIRVALIYKPAAVTPAGNFAILDSSVDPNFLDTKNRPALAQTFRSNANGGKLTVAVNHLKSKGSTCDDVGDSDVGDGQGNCNGTRTAAATALVNWLATDPTASGDPDYLIVGDLNSYAMEDPITAIKSAGYTDLAAAYLGDGAYSYIFEGQSGYLDYALSSPNLTTQVTGVAEWHINADEPAALDYNDYNQPALYQPDAYRSSDHDPVIVGLQLNGPPVCSAAAPSISSLWPVNHQFIPIDVLGVTDPDGDPISIRVDAIYQDEPVNSTGDGSSAPDGQGLGTPTAEVRAERDGGGNGRVYHIYFAAISSPGDVCTGEVLVGVPKSQGKNGAAVDDGPLYDSTIP
ncbi:MAG: ExeM/NucH family extracellular endonuclease, partial [Caldilineales bacterium]|nr:ExeM/NucH family extracellular endonuclease [Caldilineales bacterium]